MNILLSLTPFTNNNHKILTENKFFLLNSNIYYFLDIETEDK